MNQCDDFTFENDIALVFTYRLFILTNNLFCLRCYFSKRREERERGSLRI